jgi:hypothetical protein
VVLGLCGLEGMLVNIRRHHWDHGAAVRHVSSMLEDMICSGQGGASLYMQAGRSAAVRPAAA